MNKINTLYFKNQYLCVPDFKALDYARELKNGDLYTSSEIVILAARVLLLRKEIPLFNLEINNKLFILNENGRFLNGSYPDCEADKLIEELFDLQ